MNTNGRAGSGCWQAVIIVALLVWLGVAPLGVMLLADAVLSDVTTPAWVATATLVVTALLLLTPFVGVALIVRRRAGWQAAAAVAAGGAAIAGYLLLDAAVRAVFPDKPSLHGEGAEAAALRLVLLVPYVLLAAWLMPRLAGVPRRSLWAWLGLSRFDPPTVLLALAAAALVMIPWPLTGALGDSLTSLSLAFQTAVWTLPQVMLFWGLIFGLLTSTFPRAWAAALAVLASYAAFALSGALPAANWGAAGNGLILLPLAFLLTELRARGNGIYPLLPLAFLYRVTPLLFMDPRDAIVQGIPEVQHILSNTVMVLTALALGLVLWIERRVLLALGERFRIPVWMRLTAWALAAVVAWGTWSGLYLFAGEPGFANDGFLIILNEQADLSVARAISDREMRLEAVRNALIETAERTQAPLREELDSLGVPYRPYYIINMIRVDGHRWLVSRFRNRPGVAAVILNPNVRRYPRRIPLSGIGKDDGGISGEVQSNLAAIHADDAWALGVTGEGIVVAGQDTGYDWTHPALKSHYRGWDGQTADHDYNWHDAWDDRAEPFDDDMHGTHTMGIVLGDDGAGNRTGVAPGARWFGCRNMRRGLGNPGAYAECMEFFLAPYPHGGDPFTDGDTRYAPHIVNNSWGCPDIEGCFPDTLRPAVEALRAAGIMMVVSVGNDGPACGTATTPPANYDAVFSVGATDNEGNIVGFSSRGPADGLLKPDVSAPGDWVRSSVPGGGYGYAGGTSMAGPHVTGLVALLWSAAPALVGDIDATEALICRTAQPRPVEEVCTAVDEVPKGTFTALLYNPVCACGGTTGTPNNVYGCGFIDAGAAVREALGK